jgi:hypothetical protein
VTADEDHWHVRRFGSKSLDQANAAEPGHHHISQDQGDLISMPSEDLEGGKSVER